jgi:hypothetical protein
MAVYIREYPHDGQDSPGAMQDSLGAMTDALELFPVLLDTKETCPTIERIDRVGAA